jgi:hypothetical protein
MAKQTNNSTKILFGKRKKGKAEKGKAKKGKRVSKYRGQGR